MIGFSHSGHVPTALGGRHNLSGKSYYCVACRIYGCVEVMTTFLTQQFSPFSTIWKLGTKRKVYQSVSAWFLCILQPKFENLNHLFLEVSKSNDNKLYCFDDFWDHHDKQLTGKHPIRYCDSYFLLIVYVFLEKHNSLI